MPVMPHIVPELFHFAPGHVPQRHHSYLRASIMSFALPVIETSEMTAATPMIIPRVVRKDLILLLFMALYEILIERSGFMGLIVTDRPYRFLQA